MEKEDICRMLFWQGSCYAMSFPSQLAKALEVTEKEKLVIYLDKDENLVVERFVHEKEYPANAMKTTARVIGAVGWKSNRYVQLGFTVPKPIAEKIKDVVFSFPVIEKKEGKYFKLVFKKLVTAQAHA